MLNCLTPEQFNEWMAAYRLGIDDSWHQATLVASTVHNSITWHATTRAGVKYDADQAIHPHQLLPDAMQDDAPPPADIPHPSIARAEKQLEARYGNDR